MLRWRNDKHVGEGIDGLVCSILGRTKISSRRYLTRTGEREGEGEEGGQWDNEGWGDRVIAFG